MEPETRAELILYHVTDLVDRFLTTDRESDTELKPGDIESAVIAGEITADQIAARFGVVLKAKLP